GRFRDRSLAPGTLGGRRTNLLFASLRSTTSAGNRYKKTVTDSTAREHIGVGALEAERAKLLSEFDVARAQTDDDSVKTEHGVSAEALFRSFLAQFLPKKFGVTKGYIITPELAYAGPLEEWDVII